MGIIAWYHKSYARYDVADLFFLLMVTAFLIGTFCLLVSCLFSLSTGGIISKTIYVGIFNVKLKAEFIIRDKNIFDFFILGTNLPFRGGYTTIGWSNYPIGRYK